MSVRTSVPHDKYVLEVGGIEVGLDRQPFTDRQTVALLCYQYKSLYHEYRAARQELAAAVATLAAAHARLQELLQKFGGGV